ncbi:MAG: hypothetical protein FWC82_00300 [Firmicutes bacterium]|nr:hypothetical protein [Bacillota bacterium]
MTLYWQFNKKASRFFILSGIFRFIFGALLLTLTVLEFSVPARGFGDIFRILFLLIFFSPMAGFYLLFAVANFILVKKFKAQGCVERYDYQQIKRGAFIYPVQTPLVISVFIPIAIFALARFSPFFFFGFIPLIIDTILFFLAYYQIRKNPLPYSIDR